MLRPAGILLFCIPAAATAQSLPDPPLANVHESNPALVERYNRIYRHELPMTPEMITNLRQGRDETRRAAESRPEIKPLSTARLVSLEPGQQPIGLDLHPGVVTAIVVRDATGQPWPITGYVIGDRDTVTVIQAPESQQQGASQGLPPESAAVVSLSPQRFAGWTNLLLTLQDEPVPIFLTLRIQPDTAHYRLDLQVLGRGPYAAAAEHDPLGGLLPGNRTLSSFLSGADVPADAKPITTNHPDVRAWSWNDSLWVRSRKPLLSPGWSDAMTGAGDTRVYRIPGLPPVLLISLDGRPTRVVLSADDIHLPAHGGG